MKIDSERLEGTTNVRVVGARVRQAVLQQTILLTVLTVNSAVAVGGGSEEKDDY